MEGRLFRFPWYQRKKIGNNANESRLCFFLAFNYQKRQPKIDFFCWTPNVLYKLLWWKYWLFVSTESWKSSILAPKFAFSFEECLKKIESPIILNTLIHSHWFIQWIIILCQKINKTGLLVPAYFSSKTNVLWSNFANVQKN